MVGTAAPLQWDGERLHVLDQTLLPFSEVVLELASADETAAAIARLAVRGAPLIGVAAGYGVAMEAARGGDEAAVARLRSSRPTAVNLAWAVDRVLAAWRSGGAAAARAEAEAIHREDEAASAALGRHGADFLQARIDRRPARLMTHCNTGCLAASGRGTALAVVAEMADRGPVEVFACEARPLLQGARLTVWELERLGLPHRLLVDAAAAGTIVGGGVDAVVVGADRIAANGDVANKVGTLGLALAAREAGIPFVVAAPSSTVDAGTPDGAAIEVEQRDPEEVRQALGTPTTVPGTEVLNPAFDVTPARLISAIVTEEGVRA